MEPFWFPRGSLRDHRWVKLGPDLEPARFLFDPSWILGGSTLNQFGTVWFPRGSLRDHSKVKTWTQLVIGPFRNPSGFSDPYWNRGGSQICPYINNIGPLSDLAWSLGGTLLVQYWIPWNHFGSFADPSGILPGSSLDPIWN